MVAQYPCMWHQHTVCVLIRGSFWVWAQPKRHFCRSQTRMPSVTLFCSWWRHQKDTFSALLSLCAGNSSVTGEFPSQRLVTRSFDVFFDLRLNKQLSKHPWGWWFGTSSCSLWRHCNVFYSISEKEMTRLINNFLEKTHTTRYNSRLRQIFN